MKNWKLTASGIGLIIGVLGAVATFYQVFGARLIWAVFAILGICIFFWSLAAILRDIGSVVATFGSRWRLIHGQLMIGNTINVALRAKTIQRILTTFEDALSDMPRFRNILRTAGEAVGKEFAGDLRAELLQRRVDSIVEAGRTERIIKEKLKLWCKYDSSTGMGVFTIENLNYRHNRIDGVVTLRNSFLSFDRHTTKPTCSFIEGYITGIFHQLLGISVEVRETRCNSMIGDGVCEFAISSKDDEKKLTKTQRSN